MHTECITVDSSSPDATALGRAAEILRSGGLVAFPTETVYGLGAHALDESAVAKIFAAKGRPANNPLIVHVPHPDAARTLAADWPTAARQLAERFWPGSLTIVVPKNESIPNIVTAGGQTVGLRVPAHPVALALLEAADLPVAAPSANRSNRLSPTTADHVAKDLDGRIDLLLDGGPAWGGLESTVIDLTTEPPCILRPGLVTRLQIEGEIGSVNDAAPAADAALRSPGMLKQHYAPRARLECVHETETARVHELLETGQRVGWLTFEEADDFVSPNLIKVKMPDDAVTYAARLYAALHDFDDAGVEYIVVTLPPSTEAWSAVHDRLKRASAR